jgi:hypothetical protein
MYFEKPVQAKYKNALTCCSFKDIANIIRGNKESDLCTLNGIMCPIFCSLRA